MAVKSRYAWGRNDYGQMGDGTTDDSLVPLFVEEIDYVCVSVRLDTVLAIDPDGKMWHWGWNGEGQDGNGATDTDPHTTRTQVGTDTDWAYVSQGDMFVHAIKTDGTLWAWGYNGWGVFGNNTFDEDEHPTPTQIGSATNWLFVAGGRTFAVAIKTDNTLWAIGGFNANGQLGDGTTTDFYEPQQIDSDPHWVYLCCGDSFTLGLKDDGTRWAWGSNSNGRLGDGTEDDILEPTQIGADTWIALNAGEAHGIGIKSAGTLWGWGYNADGQVGDGTTTQRLSPVQIGSDTDWAALCRGSSNYNFAIKNSGSLWAWGNPIYGKLGNNDDTTPVLEPEQVGSGITWDSAYAQSISSIGFSSGSPRVRNSLEIVYDIKFRIVRALEISYAITIIVRNALEISTPIYSRAVQQLGIHYGYQVRNQFEIDAGFNIPVRSQLVSEASLHQRVVNQLSISHEIKSTDRILKSLKIKLPILNDVPIIVTDTPTATIKGQVIPLDVATVRIDEGEYAWKCNITLFDANHYSLFNTDDAFTVHLPGEDYEFIVDNKTLNRGSIVDVVANIAGISPIAIYGTPRAKKISKTWGAVMASDVAAELFPNDEIDWQILDWMIPANVLGIENQTPMEVLQRIAEAAGGVVDGLPDGTAVVRYRFPVSVVNYDSVTPDQEYLDSTHNFSIGENVGYVDIVNKLRILDAEPGATGNNDSIEFEQDKTNPSRGVLKVQSKPFRSTVTLEHTGNPSRVSATSQGVKTQEFTETVEVIAGKGSVSKPIYQVVDHEYLVVDLGAISFESDSNEFTTATAAESLVEITYRTRYVEYRAAAYPDAEVQFLVREPV